MLSLLPYQNGEKPFIQGQKVKEPLSLPKNQRSDRYSGCNLFDSGSGQPGGVIPAGLWHHCWCLCSEFHDPLCYNCTQQNGPLMEIMELPPPAVQKMQEM